jgi:amino acid permease
MGSMVVAVSYLIFKAAENIGEPTYAKCYTRFEMSGVPYFFGISCFAFEGNNVTIEMYRQMKDKKKFPLALGTALLFVTFVFQFTGIFIYWAFA